MKQTKKQMKKNKYWRGEATQKKIALSEDEGESEKRNFWTLNMYIHIWFWLWLFCSCFCFCCCFLSFFIIFVSFWSSRASTHKFAHLCIQFLFHSNRIISLNIPSCFLFYTRKKKQRINQKFEAHDEWSEQNMKKTLFPFIWHHRWTRSKCECMFSWKREEKTHTHANVMIIEIIRNFRSLPLPLFLFRWHCLLQGTNDIGLFFFIHLTLLFWFLIQNQRREIDREKARKKAVRFQKRCDIPYFCWWMFISFSHTLITHCLNGGTKLRYLSVYLCVLGCQLLIHSWADWFTVIYSAAQFIFLSKNHTITHQTLFLFAFIFFLCAIIFFGPHSFALALTSIEICHENFRFGLFICLRLACCCWFFLLFSMSEELKNCRFFSSIGSLKFPIAQFHSHTKILHNYISLLPQSSCLCACLCWCVCVCVC